MAELTIMLVILLMLIAGVTTLGRLSVSQLRLRGEARAEAGAAALKRATAGWVEDTQNPENRSDPYHRVNAHARLEAYSPALASRLPASNYTLAARNLAEDELGMETETRRRSVPLDDLFIDLIYNKNTVLLREEVTFPATTGLWK